MVSLIADIGSSYISLRYIPSISAPISMCLKTKWYASSICSYIGPLNSFRSMKMSLLVPLNKAHCILAALFVLSVKRLKACVGYGFLPTLQSTPKSCNFSNVNSFTVSRSSSVSQESIAVCFIFLHSFSAFSSSYSQPIS